MRLRFRQQLLAYFLVIFGLYTLGVIYFEQKQEKEYRTEALQSKLDGYTEMIHRSISSDKEDMQSIIPIVNTMPDSIRVSIIDEEGKVLYDNNIKKYNQLENHLERVEIKGALFQSFGTNIRQSASTKQEYLYYAKHYTDHYVRVALPYNVHTKNLLDASNHFIYTTIVLFILVLLLLYIASNRFNKSIQDLKELTNRVKKHAPLPTDMEFTDDELGDISKELVKIFDQKEKSKITIEAEREKLRQHFQYSEEGLAIFTPHFKKMYMNTHFIQYVNMLSEAPIFNINEIFGDKSFYAVKEFIEHRRKEENTYNSQIDKEGKVFSIKSAVFEDNSFELTIRDVTKVVKNRQLKQEMTSNIAHELRTPITAIRGFLETIHEQNLPPDILQSFTAKAYLQSIRLSELIEDVSLLSKVEEENASFDFVDVDFALLINNVIINSTDKLIANGSQLQTNLQDHVMVWGNYGLLFSTIQNLVDNSLKYAGKDISINIECYTEDEAYYYFSFFDTGKGVDEKHLNKLFERFYRIDEGRDRSGGGSGLGLSIVKNIILLHKGDIQVKKHASGGLQFLFKLEKVHRSRSIAGRY